MVNQQLHIALAFDQNYLNQFFVLTQSIVENHKRGEVSFHIIATGISPEWFKKIEQFVSAHGHGLRFYSIDETTIKKFVLVNQWTHAVYLRLFFPLVIPNTIHKILYLDTDTIVTNPLYDLWETDLGTLPLAAVYDNYVKTQPLLGIIREGEYFNSGVMLINTHRWNALSISEKTMAFLQHNPEKILFVDQCGLNAVLKGLWHKLPDRFNFMYSSVPATASLRELKNTVTHQVLVIHFTLQRPWHMLCRNRLAYFYHHYRKLSLARTAPRYTDFSVFKIPAFLKIKLLNLYFDMPWLGRLWRTLKP